MIISRISAKAQTTVPRAVRRALGVKPGDALEYVIEDGKVLMRKAQVALEDPFAEFGEWDSLADREAYADL